MSRLPANALELNRTFLQVPDTVAGLDAEATLRAALLLNRLYAERLGVDKPKVLVRDQAKRWGSCTSKGELRFNWRIVMGPMSLVDYVVAHEVCHLRVADHSARFWKLLGMIQPDHETCKERLRREGINFRL